MLEFKGMQIASVWDIYQSFVKPALQVLRGQSASTGGSSGPNTDDNDGIQKAKPGGKGNDEEHNSLIAMAEAHFEEKGLQITSAEESAVTRTRFSKLMAIFKALRDQNKAGGAEKLMQIIGHESYLQGTGANQKVVRGPKTEGQPERIDIHNVRERTNPPGKLIIRFLTDLETQEAVELLVASSITDNSKDSTAAALKATKEATNEALKKAKQWLRDHDTLGWHVRAATAATSKETVERILKSAPAERLVAAIETAATPEKKREREEALKSFLLTSVTDFKKPVVTEHQERKKYWKGFTPSVNKVIGILALICVACLIFLGTRS